MESFVPLKSRFAVLILLILSPGVVSGEVQPRDTLQNKGVQFAGLTNTITSLLKTRNRQPALIGSNETDLESLIVNDLAEVFSCDSIISQYLDAEGENATYGMLAYELRREIESRFDNNDGFLNVDVMSDTTTDGLFINFSIYAEKPVSVPVIFTASDSSFSTRFDSVCTAEFNADIDLFVDVSMAERDSLTRAISIRINTFTIGLYSVPWDEFEYHDCFECEPDSVLYSALAADTGHLFGATIDGQPYNAALQCFILYVKSYWYLDPTDTGSYDGDEYIPPTLTYEQIENGDFTWEVSHLNALETGIVMLPAAEKWDSVSISENRELFHFSVDDVFNEESLELISLCCNHHIEDDVTFRRGK